MVEDDRRAVGGQRANGSVEQLGAVERTAGHVDGDAGDVEARGITVELAGPGPGEAVAVAKVPGVPVALDAEGGCEARQRGEQPAEDGQAGGRVGGVAGEDDEVGSEGSDDRRQPLLETGLGVGVEVGEVNDANAAMTRRQVARGHTSVRDVEPPRLHQPAVGDAEDADRRERHERAAGGAQRPARHRDESAQEDEGSAEEDGDDEGDEEDGDEGLAR